jgi:hypothetical protein
MSRNQEEHSEVLLPAIGWSKKWECSSVFSSTCTDVRLFIGRVSGRENACDAGAILFLLLPFPLF